MGASNLWFLTGFPVGAALAWAYLAWVRASARRAARAGPAWALLLIEGMVRVTLAAAVFVVLARQGGVTLLATFSGFLVVRGLLIRRWGRLSARMPEPSEGGASWS